MTRKHQQSQYHEQDYLHQPCQSVKHLHDGPLVEQFLVSQVDGRYVNSQESVSSHGSGHGIGEHHQCYGEYRV